MNEFVAAETGIRQLHARYVDAVFRKDIEAFGDCFAEDAEWRVGGSVMRGREQVKKAMGAAFANYTRILMTFRTPIVDISDGVVSARTYVSENSQFTDGRPFGPIGIYFERFVKEGDRWLFKWRLFQTNYAGPPDLSSAFFDVPDYGAPPALPHVDEITIDRSGAGPKVD
jgi:ketosteroid isomerase-like protein